MRGYWQGGACEVLASWNPWCHGCRHGTNLCRGRLRWWSNDGRRVGATLSGSEKVGGGLLGAVRGCL